MLYRVLQKTSACLATDGAVLSLLTKQVSWTRQVVRNLCSLNREREVANCLAGLRPSRSARLLDIGCGDGFWTKRFAPYFRSVVGVDPDGDQLNVARKFHGYRVKYVKGKAESLGFADASFDRIVSVSCLEHFADPETCLREFHRVLKPKGLLAISVDSLVPQNSSSEFREWHCHKYLVTNYFEETTLLAMLSRAGFVTRTDTTIHLLHSRSARWIREKFIRNPEVWVWCFPLLYALVRLFDCMPSRTPGQIMVVSAHKPTHSVMAAD